MSVERSAPARGGLRLLAVALVLLTLAGCGSERKKTYPVRGKFVWPDETSAKELSGGMVIFQCDAEQTSSKAPIDQEGRFVLGTYTLDDGTVAGKHKVLIVQPSITNGDTRSIEVVHRKYQELGTSDLEVTVEPRNNDDIVLKVQPGAWMKKRKP